MACSHGDLIPVTLDLLFTHDGVEVDGSGIEKGSVWTLRFEGGVCTGGQYAPAP